MRLRCFFAPALPHRDLNHRSQALEDVWRQKKIPGTDFKEEGGTKRHCAIGAVVHGFVSQLEA